jgi:hypothetical protein
VPANSPPPFLLAAKRALTRSLMVVASLGTPFHHALHDYEIEMIRYGFDALGASLQGPDNRRVAA